MPQMWRPRMLTNKYETYLRSQLDEIWWRLNDLQSGQHLTSDVAIPRLNTLICAWSSIVSQFQENQNKRVSCVYGVKIGPIIIGYWGRGQPNVKSTLRGMVDAESTPNLGDAKSNPSICQTKMFNHSQITNCDSRRNQQSHATSHFGTQFWNSWLNLGGAFEHIQGGSDFLRICRTLNWTSGSVQPVLRTSNWTWGPVQDGSGSDRSSGPDLSITKWLAYSKRIWRAFQATCVASGGWWIWFQDQLILWRTQPEGCSSSSSAEAIGLQNAS